MKCTCKPNPFQCGSRCLCFGCHGTGCLTVKQREALSNVAWGVEHFGGLVSGRATPVRRLVSLERYGLVENMGSVAVCDGDGFLLRPERYRDGWRLTGLGREVLRRSA